VRTFDRFPVGRLRGGSLTGAARRFLTLLGIAAGVTVLGSMVLAAAGGVSVRRALSLGLYLAGSFLLLAGFFVGNRGRARVETTPSQRGEGIGPAVGARRVRGATKEEQSETIGTSAIFISLGVVMLVGAVVIDSRHDLV
jgi:hypothetical protein